MPYTGITLYGNNPDASPSPTEGRITLRADEDLTEELELSLPPDAPQPGETLVLNADERSFSWLPGSKLVANDEVAGSPVAATLTDSDVGQVHIFNSTGTGTVTLPDLTASNTSLRGQSILIKRAGAQLDVTPAAGDSINGLGAGVALSITSAGGSMLLFALAENLWAAFLTP